MKISEYSSVKTPKIIYREKAYWNILALMSSEHAKTKEFMFYGLVEGKFGNNFVIERFDLIPNKSTSGAYCECDEEKYADWFIKTYEKDERKRVRVHAHSHVNMGTTPSGTDNEEFKKCADLISNYFIQLIVNHRNENTCNIIDKEVGLKYEEVPCYILIANNKYAFEQKTHKFYKWNEEKKEVGAELTFDEIQDGNYEVKGGMIKLNEDVFYSLKLGTTVVDGEFLQLSSKGDYTFYISDEQEKAVADNFKELMKVTTYGYGSYYGTNTASPKPASSFPAYGANNYTPGKNNIGSGRKGFTYDYDYSNYDDYYYGEEESDFYKKYYGEPVVQDTKEKEVEKTLNNLSKNTPSTDPEVDEFDDVKISDIKFRKHILGKKKGKFRK